jgi:hypothetical protein
VLPNVLSVSRFFDDLPPIATDQELLDWSNELMYGESTPQVEPPPVPRDDNTLSLEELLADIEGRATEVYARARA